MTQVLPSQIAPAQDVQHIGEKLPNDLQLRLLELACDLPGVRALILQNRLVKNTSIVQADLYVPLPFFAKSLHAFRIIIF